MFRAIVFDIGQTLVEYHKPLSWAKLYRPALKDMAARCGYTFSEKQYQHAVGVLTKYNTRMNPRDYEVSSTQIFTELLDGTDVPGEDMERMKYYFYNWFRQGACVFWEVEKTLKILSQRGVLLGTLSDVAYAMDNVYALGDIASVIKYIDYPLTSNDVGFRKPRAEGLWLLSRLMGVAREETAFVGDEEKDIRCAQNAGVHAILINRTGTPKHYGQEREIRSLSELL